MLASHFVALEEEDMKIKYENFGRQKKKRKNTWNSI
jgi:hypothetical protein